MHHSNDPASLDNLYDIIEPVSVSLWWPLAPGWWLLLAVALLLIGLITWRLAVVWKKNEYRRLALKEIESIPDPRTLPVVLKRVALAAYPRETVAGLAGKRWISFLNHEVHGCFDDEAGRLMLALDYGKEESQPLKEEEYKAVIDSIRTWIQKHPSKVVGGTRP